MALYMYSAELKVDAITFLNHLRLSVSYKVLFKKLRDITLANKLYIKKQVKNTQLVSTWDNFQFKKNVQRKYINNMIKFRSIRIIL